MRPSDFASRRLLLCALVFVLLCSGKAASQQPPAVDDSGYPLSTTTKSQIQTVADELRQKTGIDLLLVAATRITSTPGRTAMALAPQRLQATGQQDKTIIIVMLPESGQWGLYNTDDLDPVLSRPSLQRIYDSLQPDDRERLPLDVVIGVAQLAASRKGVALTSPLAYAKPPASSSRIDRDRFRLIVGVAIVVIVLVPLLARFLYESRRRTELAKVAATMGFSFHPERTPDVPYLSIFREGNRHYFTNLLMGTWLNFPTQVFDFRYRVIIRASRYYDHRVTIAAFRSLRADLPQFELRRNEVPFYSPQKKMGLVDSITFDSHPDFTRHWLLTGADPQAVRTLFQAPLLEFLLSPRADRNLHVESAPDGWVAIYKEHGYRGYKRIAAAKVPAFVEEVALVAAAIFAEASSRTAAAGAAAGTFAGTLSRTPVAGVLTSAPPMPRDSQWQVPTPQRANPLATLSWVTAVLMGCLILLWLLYHVGDLSEAAQGYVAIGMAALVVLGGIGLVVALFRMGRDML